MQTHDGATRMVTSPDALKLLVDLKTNGAAVQLLTRRTEKVRSQLVSVVLKFDPGTHRLAGLLSLLRRSSSETLCFLDCSATAVLGLCTVLSTNTANDSWSNDFSRSAMAQDAGKLVWCVRVEALLKPKQGKLCPISPIQVARAT